MLKHGILAVLNYGDCIDYELMESLRDSLVYFWEEKTSQIYRELKELEERGFVTGRIVAQEKQPDKKIYSITQAGRDEFMRWLRDSATPMNLRIPIIMKILFSGELTREECVEHFQNMKNEYLQYRQYLSSATGDISHYRNWEMTLDYEKRYVGLMLEWCDDCIAHLQAKQPTPEQGERSSGRD